MKINVLPVVEKVNNKMDMEEDQELHKMLTTHCLVCKGKDKR